TVSSHDVLTPAGADLQAEIYFNGAPFDTPVYTGYVFGALGNEPLLAGTYTVVHPDYAGWVPASVVIVDVNQNYTTNFLGIRYILNVTSTPVAQGIYKDTVATGVLTNGSFYNKDLSALLGNYTLEAAPFGFHWVPTNIEVVAGDFNAGNNYTYTIFFELEADTLPVELSSFTATITAQNYVKLTWVSHSESDLLGYRVYRNDIIDHATAILITPTMVPATNTSTTHSYTTVDDEVVIGNTYYYFLESIDMGSSTFHDPISVYVEGEVPPVLPQSTMMQNAYPNPFKLNSNVTINVALKAGENGTVSIFNVLGQLVQSYNVKEGLNPLSWNGRDNNGNACGSGIYFYKLSTPSVNLTKKMAIIK
ncbi:MAG: T9SS type A sorting domain-containing protein, partial [Candidatus Cloacimonetes bacterium]|nr:T9SS type A sorting domain-containing protein [Candidatus Cloacimonadota bacterium]